MLPRNSSAQARSDQGEALEFPEDPGDLVFFGPGRVTHVGLYLGDGIYIHAGIGENRPMISQAELKNSTYPILGAQKIKPASYQASISEINDEIRARMTHSWREDNPISVEDLCYISLNHWGFDGCVHQGALIVQRGVAREIVDIFEELFNEKYRIEKMLLIDAYQGSDELSCEDNNSSAFCSRLSTNKGEWSYHSYGLAIDLNPLLNPYHREGVTIPVNGEEFLDRSLDCRGLITKNDPCYRAFTSRGWKWGGDWFEDRGYVDFQHFYRQVERCF